MKLSLSNHYIWFVAIIANPFLGFYSVIAKYNNTGLVMNWFTFGRHNHSPYSIIVNFILLTQLFFFFFMNFSHYHSEMYLLCGHSLLCFCVSEFWCTLTNTCALTFCGFCGFLCSAACDGFLCSAVCDGCLWSHFVNPINSPFLFTFYWRQDTGSICMRPTPDIQTVGVAYLSWLFS